MCRVISTGTIFEQMATQQLAPADCATLALLARSQRLSSMPLGSRLLEDVFFCTLKSWSVLRPPCPQREFACRLRLGFGGCWAGISCPPSRPPLAFGRVCPSAGFARSCLYAWASPVSAGGVWGGRTWPAWSVFRRSRSAFGHFLRSCGGGLSGWACGLTRRRGSPIFLWAGRGLSARRAVFRV